MLARLCSPTIRRQTAVHQQFRLTKPFWQKLAASRGDHSVVLAASQRLNEVLRLLAQQAQLAESVESLKNGSDAAAKRPIHSDNGNVAAAHGTTQSSRVLSPREYAEQQKTRFLVRLASSGLHMRRLSGALYRSPSGASVGLAFATERQPNRWFLGLPDGAFDKVALLCEDRNGTKHAICLDKEFVARHGKALSISGHQRKFNVRRDGPHFLLKLPGQPAIDVTAFRNNYENLR